MSGFWGEDDDKKVDAFTPHGIVDSNPMTVGPAIVPTGIAGDQPSTPYAASDQGSMMAAELQKAGHSSVPITDKEMADAQSQVNQAVAQAMYATKGLSPEEREAAVQDAVGKVALPPQLGQQQLAQMTEQAVKVNQDAVIAGGQSESPSQDQTQQQASPWGKLGEMFMNIAAAVGLVSLPARDREEAVAAGHTLGNNTRELADLGKGTTAMAGMEGLAFTPGTGIPGPQQQRAAGMSA